MKRIIVLFLICFISVNSFSQSITIENNTQEADSNVLKFKDFLIQEKVINPKNNINLRIDYFIPRAEPISIDFYDFGVQNRNFQSFHSSVFFNVSDSTTNISFKGIILENELFVNIIDYYRISNSDLTIDSIEKSFKLILQKYYPTYHLDSTYSSYVKDQNENYVGEIKYEYKTLTRIGCNVTENFEFITQNKFKAFIAADNCEAVFVFYHNAPAEFNIKGKCYGEQFEMYDQHLELIHKGIISKYY